MSVLSVPIGQTLRTPPLSCERPLMAMENHGLYRLGNLGNGKMLVLPPGPGLRMLTGRPGNIKSHADSQSALFILRNALPTWGVGGGCTDVTLQNPD